MTRRVVPSDQVLHLWAHQAQDSARNGTGSVFFEGDTAYSYRHSWPLGTIYKRRGETLVLLNFCKYSVTTMQHQSMARRAVSHLSSCDVPYVKIGSGMNTARGDHQRNLKHFADEIARYLAAAQRVMAPGNVEWRQRAAEHAARDAAKYVAFFDKRLKAPTVDAAAFTAAWQRAQAIASPDPVRDAKRYKAREARQARERAAQQVWRDTGAWPQARQIELPADAPRPYLDRKTRRAFGRVFDTLPQAASTWTAPYERGDTLLRVHGAEIVTSLGARIPLDHAPRLWRLIQRCKASGTPYVRNGHTEHAGQFAVDEITADGDMRAGCHYIKYAELALLAKTLNLPE